MRLARPVYLLGGACTPFIGKFHPDFIWKGHPDFGRRTNPGLESLLARAVLAALADAGVGAERIERGFVGNFAGECFSKQGHLGAVLAGVHPALRRKPHVRLEGACASGGLAVAAAAEAVAAGARFVLAAGAEVQTTVDAREGADFLARAGSYARQRSIDPFTFPCLFARRARAYREAHGAGRERTAHAVLKAHQNAARNPLAHLHAVGREMTLERALHPSEKSGRFLENPAYREELCVLDCSPVSDGAAAIVLASAEGLAELGRSPIHATEITGLHVAADDLEAPLEPGFDLLRLSTTEAAAAEAYAAAGIGPKEVQVAEVHDCFAIAEALMMEALGFAPLGGGADLIASGATAIEGRLPVNTGGGLIGFGHPVGATGVKQALEIHRQLLGKAGDYQVAPTPKIGLASNMGGDDRTAVVSIQRRGR